MMDNTWYYNTDSQGRPTLYCKRKEIEGTWITLVFFYQNGFFNMDNIILNNNAFHFMLSPNYMPTSLQIEFVKYFFKFDAGVNPEW